MDLYNTEHYITNINPSLCCGLFSTFYIDINGNVYSFGRNKSCKLGHRLEGKNIYYPKQIKSLINIKSICCGDEHTVCLDIDGKVFTFGCNTYDNLGINKSNKELPYTHIPQRVDLPTICRISCGDNFTICNSDTNDLYSFGSNLNGALGIKNKNGTLPNKISSICDVEYVVTGDYHVICKTFNGKYYSWGKNNKGQLGQGHTNYCLTPKECINWPNDIISIQCGELFTLILTKTGNVYSCGNNQYSQLGLEDKGIIYNKPTLVETLSKIVRITCGYNHSICLDIHGNFWAFGRNFYGQLGFGHTKDSEKPTINTSITNIIDIISGANQTFFKTIDNKIYACGFNKEKQLGIKTKEVGVSIPIQVLKDNEDIWCSTIGKSRQKSARK